MAGVLAQQLAYVTAIDARFGRGLADALVAAGATLTDSLERVDVLVIADIDSVERPVEAFDDDAIDMAWDRPVRDALTLMQAARAGGASRVIVVTPAVSLVGRARLSAACAAIEAKRLMALSAARQWRAHGVTVNCLATSLDPHPESIAPTVVFLASPASHYLTGATLSLDGGSELAL
ncbi:MAG: hypothetical protein H0U92_00030 [Actinobacteria bacterium]|nr:hypothetical protein [Actinomycetota bacterium]